METKEPHRVMPTGYTPWDIYQIVRESWAPYRSFTVDDAKLGKDDVVKAMNIAGYVTVRIHQGDWKGQVAILDRNHGPPIMGSTEKFKLFYNSVAVADVTLFIVAPCRFDSHVLNYIHEKKLEGSIVRIEYDHLKTVLPLGPSSPVHTLMDDAAAAAVKDFFQAKRRPLKPLFTNDGGYVWCGGEHGQVVQISRRNRMGTGVTYRQIVQVPLS